MQWKSLKYDSPQESGKYIVSAHINRQQQGTHVVECAAEYDATARRWYKYDPFNESSPKEDITPMVVGWISGLPAFLG